MGIIAGLAMFLFLITIHELGHFIGAKLLGIKVNEFSIGMGPAIFKNQSGETLYSLRLLPIGGYVMMEGEEESSDDPRAYENSAAWKRFLTIFAGPFMNFLFAFIVFFAISAIQGTPTTIIGDVQISSPAADAGILAGDQIIEINGNNVDEFSDVSKYINEDSDNYIIKVSRDGLEEEISITPEIENDGSKKIGVYPKLEKNITKSLTYGVSNTFQMTKMVWDSLMGLFTGLFGINDLSGPVGIISQVGEFVKMGFVVYLNLAALISINLGLFNLLPIPALDGSKLLFILFEMIFRKPVNKKFEQRITIAGFAVLLGLMIFVTIKDIIGLF